MQEEAVEVRKVNMKKSFDERTVTRTIQAVTTAVLMSLSEASEGLKVKEDCERAGEGPMWISVMLMMLMMSVFAVSMICVPAAASKLKREGRKK